MAERMTEEEFVAWVASEGGEHIGEWTAVPCDCGRPECRGWRVLYADPLKRLFGGMTE